MTYIAPAEPLGKLLEFDPDAMRHSIALGYTDTLRVLGSYIGHTYTFEPTGRRCSRASRATICSGCCAGS